VVTHGVAEAAFNERLGEEREVVVGEEREVGIAAEQRGHAGTLVGVAAILRRWGVGRDAPTKRSQRNFGVPVNSQRVTQVAWWLVLSLWLPSAQRN
jgi:hypothetical protein